jgi:hypothetical protein
MPRLTTLLVTLTLAFAGVGVFAKPPEPRGELLASIEFVEGFEPIRKRTGYWFYAEKAPVDVAGPIITGYEYQNGKLVDEFGGGSEPALYEAINKVDLEQFDFEKEVESTTDALAAENDALYGGPLVTGVRDGVRCVVTIVTTQGTFRYEGWNPGLVAEDRARFSPKLDKLDRVFDLLRRFYSDAKLPF